MFAAHTGGVKDRHCHIFLPYFIPLEMGFTLATQREMYMANARNLCLAPNATYIPLTCVGGLALGDVNNLRRLIQEIPTCWYFLR